MRKFVGRCGGKQEFGAARNWTETEETHSEMTAQGSSELAAPTTLGELDSSLVLSIYRHCLCCARRDRAVCRRWRSILPPCQVIVLPDEELLSADHVRDLMRGTEMDRCATLRCAMHGVRSACPPVRRDSVFLVLPPLPPSLPTEH